MNPWIEIGKLEFDELVKKSVLRNTVMIAEPPVTFYWDKHGASNSNLSFGRHSFLKEIREKKRYYKKLPKEEK